MANIKSQIKRNRQNAKRRARNRSVRSEINTRTAGAEAAALSGEGDAAEKLRMAVKRIDMAAAKGILHPNQASRKKSRLTRRVARLSAGDAG
ncbi:MAG: 30S ribosomal protein S20 [bacterium]|nr:30S ribosomal protein S20 [bacterium]MCY3926479.1 30S ribosomal protein S20 [bacterium]